MAACESLQHIFQKPLPENPTLLESLSSWKQIISMKPIEDSSFTEIFGELHFKENRPESSSSSSSSSSSHLPTSSPSSSLSPSSFSIDLNTESGIEKLNKDDHHSDSINGRNNKSPTASYFPGTHRKYNHSDSFSSMNSESLSLCTEGLGFESSDDLEDLKNWQHYEERTSFTKQTVSENLCSEYKRSRTNGGAFPPPISSIGRSGKPWICFKSYRHDGRFILKEIKIQTHDFLHASREDGRLKLQFIQSEDKIIEEDEEEEEEDVEGEEEEEEEKKEENNGEKNVKFSNNETGNFKC